MEQHCIPDLFYEHLKARSHYYRASALYLFAGSIRIYKAEISGKRSHFPGVSCNDDGTVACDYDPAVPGGTYTGALQHARKSDPDAGIQCVRSVYSETEHAEHPGQPS